MRFRRDAMPSSAAAAAAASSSLHARPLLERAAEAFEQAYGIKVESAGSLLTAFAFVAVAAFLWPCLLRLGISVTSDARKAKHAEPETLAQRVIKLDDENRELRAALRALNVRLEANERNAADLKVAITKASKED